VNLAERSNAPEFMDAECRDFDDYASCLRDLSRVNVATLTYRPTLAWLAKGPASFALLDVGFGYGDMLRRIRRAFPSARLAGVDRNPWAAEAARRATPEGAAIRFDTADVFSYSPDLCDYIISAQFAHHLTDAEQVSFIRWMERHARLGWLISDLHRHRLSYWGFGALAWAAGWHRFVRADGQTSIARGFRLADCKRLLIAAGLDPAAAQIRWHAPFRLTISRRK
jgi:SAM-dependent methyltransferase